MTPSWFRNRVPVWMLAIGLCASADLGAQSDAAPLIRPDRRAVFEPFTFELAVASGLDRGIASSRNVQTRFPGAPTRLDGQFGYAKRSRRVAFSVTAGAAAAYEPQLRTSSALAQAVGSHLGITIGRRTRIEMTHRVAHVPLELFTRSAYAGPSVFPALSFDSSLLSGRMVNYDGHFSVTRTLSRRSSASLSVTSLLSSARREGEQSSDVRTHMVHARVERRISAFASLRAGYGVGMAELAQGQGGGPSQQHDIDAGVDYARPLPFATDTTFRFGVGSTVLATQGARRARLTTTAALERHLARFWSARVDYTRPLQYVAGFAEPLLSDALSVELRGRLSRSASTSLSSGYSRGAVGIERGGAGFSSYSIAARLAVQVRRQWRIELEGHHSRYGFDSAVGLPAFIPEQFVRHGVRAGLAWSSSRIER